MRINKILSVLIALSLVLSVVFTYPLSVMAETSGQYSLTDDEGEEYATVNADVYTYADIQAVFSYIARYSDGKSILAARDRPVHLTIQVCDDIDFQGAVIDTPIGTLPVQAVIRGNGYSWLNFTLQSGDNSLGLFYGTENAHYSIYDLTLGTKETPIYLANTAETSWKYLGVLFGSVSLISFDIKNIDLYVAMSETFTGGTGAVGGLIGNVGLAAGTVSTVKNCNVYGTVENTKSDIHSWVGGLIGQVSGSSAAVLKLIHCVNDATVSGGRSAGGLIGVVNNTAAMIQLEYCINYGSVSSVGVRAGGLIGYQNAAWVTIENCANLGDVTASTYVGGLVGLFVKGNSNGMEITNSVNIGTITAAKGYASDLLGSFEKETLPLTVKNCTYVGTPSGTDMVTADNADGTGNIRYTDKSAAVVETLNGAYQIGFFLLTEEGDITIDKTCPQFVGIQQTKVVNGTFDVRFVAILKDYNLSAYQSVGFEVRASSSVGAFEKQLSCEYVFTSLKASTNSDEIVYEACDMGGAYLIAMSITDVPAVVEGENITVSFSVSPYAIDCNGKMLEGAVRAFSFDGGSLVGVSEPLSVLLNDVAYPAKLVYNRYDYTGIHLLRTKLLEKLGAKLLAEPVTVVDSESETDADAFEILLGNTNRTESTVSGMSENDAWYYVGVVNNQLVINGSNAYMLELAMEYFISTYIEPCEETVFRVDSITEKTVVWEDFTSEDWCLKELPYYQGGTYTASVFESGRRLTDYDDPYAEESKVAVVSSTTQTEFERYVERLKGFGYTETEREALESNVYVTLTDETQSHSVYTYYVAAKECVYIIYDSISDSVDAISEPMTSDEIAQAQNNGGSATFYLYGLNQTGLEMPETGVAGYGNNGMLLIVKCADNSVIIFDGGYAKQTDYAQLNCFLHEITNTEENEQVTVSAWVLTHLHDDHYAGFLEFITSYSALYNLKSICANVPCDLAASDDVLAMKAAMNKVIGYYPNCREIKLHTGQKLQIADVTLQALYTHEDSIDPSTGVSLLQDEDFNMTSSIFKVSADCISMLVLGDALGYEESEKDARWYKSADAYLTTVYTEETLKCDIVQVAHHALNGLTEVYDTVQASIYFIPQSYGGFQRTLPESEFIWDTVIRRSLLEGYLFPTYAQGYGTDEEMIFFSGKAELTVGLQAVNGNITEVYPIVPVSSGGENTETKWGSIAFVQN